MDGEPLGKAVLRKFVGTSVGNVVGTTSVIIGDGVIGAPVIGASVIGGMVLITVSTYSDESDSDDTFCPGTYSML